MSNAPLLDALATTVPNSLAEDSVEFIVDSTRFLCSPIYHRSVYTMVTQSSTSSHYPI
ncbi:hypothetical protein K435DRAFT_857900 [Dendrothele bispora CBS 962.96]|uniref:Uncharacterized protein n=1 Tax=Dendrothele bispora (strain CBS 962.96) TaxID=1314807 RepID=A0A4S8M4I7_DENBC|nr:hypothetical protein K435DRAFT_857898 [Dendrothele bispora CBS 962.96]THU97097.1 hypothetical protein K435DRAFT_857900 [Dendrothele bispora CBS 962.96]